MCFVCFHVDLDRCTNGKSVQILEALHLLFHESRPEDSEYFSRRHKFGALRYLLAKIEYWGIQCFLLIVACGCYKKVKETWMRRVYSREIIPKPFSEKLERLLQLNSRKFMDLKFTIYYILTLKCFYASTIMLIKEVSWKIAIHTDAFQ